MKAYIVKHSFENLILILCVVGNVPSNPPIHFPEYTLITISFKMSVKIVDFVRIFNR